MKLRNSNAPVETIGMGERREFRIKPTAKAFRILSSSLYKDKIKAIVRELSTNAYDAHRAAGKLDTPFIVHIPNPMEPFFSIRDFGDGLTHHQMEEIYTTYFESTKSDSNDDIGGYGLGCKSPFSYADSFNVVSRNGGARRTYDIFIAEDGLPSMSLRSEIKMAADEKNGLEVVVPVTNRTDVYEFKTRIMNAYTYYPVKPIFTGEVMNLAPPRRIILQGEGYKIYEWQGHQDRATAIMGVVGYPINASSLTSEDNLPNRIKSLFRLPVDIDFGIGELETTAGREDLSYDKYTIQAILKRAEAIDKDITARLSEKFQKCGSLKEAYDLYGSMGKIFSFSYIPRIVFRGKVIDSDRFTFTPEEFPNTRMYVFRNYLRRDKTKYQKVEYQTPLLPDEIFVKDVRTNMSKHMAPLLDKNSEPILVDCATEDELKKLKRFFDGVKFTPLSSLPAPTPKAKKKLKAKILNYNVFKTLTSTLDNTLWHDCEIDAADGDGAIYIPTFHNQLTFSDRDYASLQTTEQVAKFISKAASYGLIDLKKDVIYAIPATLREKGLKNWVSFDEIIKKRAAVDLKKRPHLLRSFKRSLSKQNFKFFQDKKYEFETMLWSATKYLPQDHDLNKFKIEYEEQKRDNIGFDEYVEMLYMSNNKSFESAFENNEYDLNRIWGPIVSKYPVIEGLISNPLRSDYELAKYIQQVDILSACSEPKNAIQP